MKEIINSILRIFKIKIVVHIYGNHEDKDLKLIESFTELGEFMVNKTFLTKKSIINLKFNHKKKTVKWVK